MRVTRQIRDLDRVSIYTVVVCVLALRAAGRRALVLALCAPGLFWRFGLCAPDPYLLTLTRVSEKTAFLQPARPGARSLEPGGRQACRFDLPFRERVANKYTVV